MGLTESGPRSGAALPASPAVFGQPQYAVYFEKMIQELDKEKIQISQGFWEIAGNISGRSKKNLGIKIYFWKL
jgi:hypothetical protein